MISQNIRAWLKSEKRMVEVTAIDFDCQEIQHFDDDESDYLTVDFDNVIIMSSMQYQDKNKKEIFEEDIVRTPRGDWGIIVFNAPFFEVTVSKNQSSLYSRQYFDECEVIGNRYENPELLEAV